MTQTITNCNAVPAGKTYPVEHLRTAESIEQLCAYVDAGHPIANDVGNYVYCLRRTSEDAFTYQVFWNEILLSVDVLEKGLLDAIKLAPLAYRNGRPLHVGDEIELFVSGDYLRRTSNLQSKLYKHYEWRFADEVVA